MMLCQIILKVTRHKVFASDKILMAFEKKKLNTKICIFKMNQWKPWRNKRGGVNPGSNKAKWTD